MFRLAIALITCILFSNIASADGIKLSSVEVKNLVCQISGAPTVHDECKSEIYAVSTSTSELFVCVAKYLGLRPNGSTKYDSQVTTGTCSKVGRAFASSGNFDILAQNRFPIGMGSGQDGRVLWVPDAGDRRLGACFRSMQGSEFICGEMTFR
ncbi:hypothetical protein [Bradyrhizobium sp. RT9a]|uniref:hypothetical protein n=1 Tax=Bradyrhizobium sp. RT9a TaxID=3156384 RepID=UPI0033953A33